MNLEIEQYPGELKYLRQQVVKNKPQDTMCKTHPDAPHGFDRNASHSADRYVCECEGWEPPEQEPVAWIHELADGHRHCVTNDESGYVDNFTDTYKTIPLYTAPPQKEEGCAQCGKQASQGWALYCVECVKGKEWVGLTVEEAQKFYEKYTNREELIYAIDKFLEEKNT